MNGGGSGAAGGSSVKRRRTVDDSVAARVRRSINARAAGQPFTVRDLLTLGPRAAVDQALHRLFVEGRIDRVSRGVYARPKVNSTLGAKVPVAPEKVVGAIAKSDGAKINIGGAEAARRFGLSTQMPLQQVYATTGRSRTVAVGRQSVVLRHTAPSRMKLASTPAGEALAALLYLGRNEVTPVVLATIRARLGEAEYMRLLGHPAAMPAWLSDALYATA